VRQRRHGHGAGTRERDVNRRRVQASEQSVLSNLTGTKMDGGGIQKDQCVEAFKQALTLRKHGHYTLGRSIN
jgi:hypothetical protein